MKRVGDLVPPFQQKVREMTEKDLTHVASLNDSASRATGGQNEQARAWRKRIQQLCEGYVWCTDCRTATWCAMAQACLSQTCPDTDPEVLRALCRIAESR